MRAFWPAGGRFGCARRLACQCAIAPSLEHKIDWPTLGAQESRVRLFGCAQCEFWRGKGKGKCERHVRVIINNTLASSSVASASATRSIVTFLGAALAQH